MPLAPTIRTGLLLGCLLRGASLLHAQGLPATPVTAVPALPSQTAPSVTAPPSALPKPAQRARVEYIQGKLQITAQNSSLNQILREIARSTGLKITGGVADERVFGVYGPGDTQTVLSALLDGSGSNILFIESSGNAPQELVLSPRHGGATPPNPNVAREAGREDETDAPPAPIPHVANAQRLPGNQAPNQQNPVFPGLTPQQPATQVPTSQSTGIPTNPGVPGTPTPAPAEPGPPATTTEQSPNGVKTPQQIYDQLLKLQQKAKPPVQTPPQ